MFKKLILSAAMLAFAGAAQAAGTAQTAIAPGSVTAKDGNGNSYTIPVGGTDPNGQPNTAPVNSGDILVTPSASFTRPANTTAYATGQLVGNSTTAASVTPLTWSAARLAGGNFYIRRVRMYSSGKTATNAAFTLHIYAASPTIANGDGAAWSTNVANLVCDVPVTLTDVGTDAAMGFGVPSVGSDCNVVLASGQAVYGLLQANAAYTPTSGETETVVLELHQN